MENVENVVDEIILDIVCFFILCKVNLGKEVNARSAVILFHFVLDGNNPQKNNFQVFESYKKNQICEQSQYIAFKSVQKSDVRLKLNERLFGTLGGSRLNWAQFRKAVMQKNA